jgi:hypothetical protein
MCEQYFKSDDEPNVDRPKQSMAVKRKQVDPANKILNDPRDRVTQKKSCSEKALCLTLVRPGGITLEVRA